MARGVPPNVSMCQILEEEVSQIFACSKYSSAECRSHSWYPVVYFMMLQWVVLFAVPRLVTTQIVLGNILEFGELG